MHVFMIYFNIAGFLSSHSGAYEDYVTWPSFWLLSGFAYSSTLKIGAICSSEILNFL
jgi:hypothetical protein